MCPSMSMTGWLSRRWTSAEESIASNLSALLPGLAKDLHALRRGDPQRNRGRRFRPGRVPRRRRHHRRSDHLRGGDRRAGCTRHRRRRPCRDPRVHRRSHPHGRPGVLGRHREQLVLARRDHRRDGELRIHAGPGAAEERALVVRNLERAEDIDPAALAAGIDWSFETFPQYLDAVDRLPKGINFAANVGHSALRTWAMGERAFEQEATDDDLLVMKRQLAESLQAGAIGFSTSRSEHHETSDDRPVASRLASWEEVVELVGVMGSVGTRHLRRHRRGHGRPRPRGAGAVPRPGCRPWPRGAGCR